MYPLKSVISSLLFTLIFSLIFSCTSAVAQNAGGNNANQVRPSQKASISQRVGLTDITITYSRPGVKGRTIWGALVPYDKVWRTGANEATTVSFSTDVKIEGKPLAAGTYSLHTVPTKSDWTIIFNKDANQWGSYKYDQTKDALRVTVTPRTADHREWFTISFPDIAPTNATIALKWEKLMVPVRVEVPTPPAAPAAPAPAAK